MKPREPEQRDGTVRLYHGTTYEAAERIVRTGFEPLDRDAVVEGVAREHGLSSEVVVGAASGTFLESLGRHDEDFVSFKHGAIEVEFWARIGGEARWECLKAVFVHNHPGAGIDDRETTDWAESPSNTRHVPAVVAVDVPYDAYRNLAPNAPASFEEWQRQPEMFRLGGVLWMPLPIRCEWIAGCFRIERAYHMSDVATRLGVGWSAVGTLQRDGSLPPSDNFLGGETLWWESTIRPLLPA